MVDGHSVGFTSFENGRGLGFGKISLEDDRVSRPSLMPRKRVTSLWKLNPEVREIYENEHTISFSSVWRKLI